LFLLGPALLMIFLYAPAESTMGEVQRILYVHVPVAWCSLVGCLAMGFCGAIYLFRTNLVWDHWSQAAAEVGWLCSTLTLVTGSLWAHDAWGVWWTWEPRLTSSLMLWLIFMGFFVIRASLEDPRRRARIGAVFAVVGVADVPLVLLATRWFRGVHPVTPEMDPRMRLTLLMASVSFVAFFTFVTILRKQQLELAEQCACLESQATVHG
jgi:heme exporter protein C